MGQQGYAPCSYAYLNHRSAFFQKLSTRDFACFVYFRYLPAHHTYDVALGVQSTRIREYLGQVLRAVYGEDFAQKFLAPIERPCLSMFNADDLVRWPSGEMSAYDKRTLLAELTDLFCRAVKPVFEGVCDYDQMLTLLLRDDAPFEWWRSSVSSRLAQIVVLSNLTRADWSTVRNRIKPGEELLVSDTLAGTRWRYFVDDLHEYCSEHPLAISL